MQRTPAAIALALACLGLAGAGCGSADDDATTAAAPAATASAPAPAAAAVPQELLGTYARRVTRADIQRTDKLRNESGNEQDAPTPGAVRLVLTATQLTFTDRGVQPPFTIRQSISPAAGRLAIDGYIHPEAGSFCGPEVPQNASYAWSRAGDVLTLKATDDRCADRDSLLTGDWRAAS